MKVDYLIIGQGLCGTWLSYYLLKEGKSCIVIDDCNERSASYVASGLINPVTGRRAVTTWMAKELLPFVWYEYNKLANELNIDLINQTDILVFPLAPDLLNAFYKRINEENSFVQSSGIDKQTLNVFFNFPFDVLQIAPCYLINVQELIKKWKEHLMVKNLLIEGSFDEQELLIKDDLVYYKDIKAEKIIYCNGIQTANSKFWKSLPFIPNKGQAVIADIPALNINYIFKFGHLTLIPWQSNLWWVGSSNEMDFKTIEATEDFKMATTASLRSILKIPFEIKEQISSVRPATVERRPFVGIHPRYEPIAILNGMGSKGCSLAPWFAKELSENFKGNQPVNELANVQRYTKILSR